MTDNCKLFFCSFTTKPMYVGFVMEGNEGASLVIKFFICLNAWHTHILSVCITWKGNFLSNGNKKFFPEQQPNFLINYHFNRILFLSVWRALTHKVWGKWWHQYLWRLIQFYFGKMTLKSCKRFYLNFVFAPSNIGRSLSRFYIQHSRHKTIKKFITFFLL